MIFLFKKKRWKVEILDSCRDWNMHFFSWEIWLWNKDLSIALWADWKVFTLKAISYFLQIFNWPLKAICCTKSEWSPLSSKSSNSISSVINYNKQIIRGCEIFWQKVGFTQIWDKKLSLVFFQFLHFIFTCQIKY